MTLIHESLTTLPNRYHFIELIEKAFHQHQEISLFLIDVVKFSDISSTFDYKAGDQVLVNIANRINVIFDQHVLLGRVSGDIFGLLFAGKFSNDQLQQKYMHLVDHFKEPIVINNTSFITDFNVGCANKSQNTASVTELVSKAEIALKQAKANKLENFKIASDKPLGSSSRGLALKADLKRALICEELELYFQPKVSLKTLEIVGCEALIRWNHPLDGLLFPGALIKAAESYNLMNELGYWTIEAAIRQLSKLNMQGINLPISVNLSPSQLFDPQLSKKIGSLLQDYQVQAHMVELELTEDVVLSDSILVKRQLDEIRALGISLSMDDFGKGYSNLSLLRDLKLSSIKIDKDFVMSLEENPVNIAIVQATKIISDAKGCKTIAEGIETLAQLNLLSNAGIEVGQGFLFSQAVQFERYVSMCQVGGFQHLLDDKSFNSVG